MLHVLKKVIDEKEDFCNKLIEDIQVDDDKRPCCEVLWEFAKQVEAHLKINGKEPCQVAYALEVQALDLYTAMVEVALKVLIRSSDVIQVKGKVQGPPLLHALMCPADRPLSWCLLIVLWPLSWCLLTASFLRISLRRCMAVLCGSWSARPRRSVRSCSPASRWK